MSTRYIKTYTPGEYRSALKELHESGCRWSSNRPLIYRNGRPSVSFGHAKALVVHDDKSVTVDEIRHCPDPSDRRIEDTHLCVGDKVMLTDAYYEGELYRGEVFEIVGLTMIGDRPCAFLNPGKFGAYACDGLRRI